MSRRSVATVGVAVLVVLLVAAALTLPVPYVTEGPGPTLNVLGTNGKQSVVDVSGHRTYPTTGQLRLTTVSVTNPDHSVSLPDVLRAWFDPTRAVLPRDVVYPPQQTASQAVQESDVEMTDSQDTAVAAALTALGYRVTSQVEVFAVTDGSPAQGHLRARDAIEKVNGTSVTTATQVSDAIQKTGVGKPATFVVRRGDATRRVKVTPEAAPGDAQKAVVGISVGTGYRFPFDVSVNLGQDIGGPSAGLMFSLAVYDTLTPGSLTGGSDIAGTGTITKSGAVGPIGGIQQKIVAAAAAGATVFFVPPGNCAAAESAHVDKDQIRLVKAPTMRSALSSLKTYAKDHSADLPACG